MFAVVRPVLPLIIGIASVNFGNAMFMTLLNIYANGQSFTEVTIGLMMTAYFAGIIIGTNLVDSFIHKVGFIRTLAALISILSVIATLHVLYVEPIGWIAMRLIYGACMGGAYVIIESWLNSSTANETRGRLFSIYMVVNFTITVLSQMPFQTLDTSSYIIFVFTSIMISLGLIPICLASLTESKYEKTERLGMLTLFKICPVGAFNIFAIGIGFGGFFGLGVLYMIKAGLTEAQAAQMLGITFLGGLAMQFPMGWLSDKTNRPFTIMLSAVFAGVGCYLIDSFIQPMELLSFNLQMAAFIFGCGNYVLYSLVTAHTNDYVSPDMYVKTSATLLTLNSLGAIVGPLIGSMLMASFTPRAFIILLLVINVVIVAATLLLGRISTPYNSNSTQNAS